MSPRLLTLAASAVLALTTACAAPGPRAVAPSPPAAEQASVRVQAVQVATSVIGTPYRNGGSSPRGFDCSGLVVYSYAQAGVRGLPHSAAALERRARPVPLTKLEPGDLLFFDLDGKRAGHVAIYLGDRAFVHAPSSGKHVERVEFGHVFWGKRIRRAGRLHF